MRHTLHIAMIVALGTGGCGGLENAPFRVGTVRGQLTESDPAVALVSVLGAPDLRGSVASDGTFQVERVPAGAAELFIVATASKTLRVALTVPGGQSLSLGPVVPKEASFLAVRVKAPGYQRLTEARLSVVGTPVQDLRPSASGRVSVGPLPDGCYTLSLSLPGFPEVRTETCVSAGEHKEVNVNLPNPSSGCAVTGCEDGFQCTSEGRCVECLEDAHCGPGLTCRNLRCEGEGPLCTACVGDWKCRAGASCQELPEGGSACVVECEDSEGCEKGFTCQAGQCLPNPAMLTGCHAYRQLGAACTGDMSCRELGLVTGVCFEEACTFRCTENRECPPSYVCEGSGSDRVCRLED